MAGHGLPESGQAYESIASKVREDFDPQCNPCPTATYLLSEAICGLQALPFERGKGGVRLYAALLAARQAVSCLESHIENIANMETSLTPLNAIEPFRLDSDLGLKADREARVRYAASFWSRGEALPIFDADGKKVA